MSFISAADTRDPTHLRVSRASRAEVPYLALLPGRFSLP